jgi:hypothetical protein
MYHVCAGAPTSIPSESNRTDLHPNNEAQPSSYMAEVMRVYHRMYQREKKEMRRQGGLPGMDGLEKEVLTDESADEDESDDDDDDEDDDEDEELEFPHIWPEAVLDLVGDSISGTLHAHGSCGVTKPAPRSVERGMTKGRANGKLICMDVSHGVCIPTFAYIPAPIPSVCRRDGTLPPETLSASVDASLCTVLEVHDRLCFLLLLRWWKPQQHGVSGCIDLY